MIEAYTIGVSLDLDDSITGKLEGVYQETEKVAGSVDAINSALASTSSLVGDAANSLHALTAAFGQATQAAKALQDAAAGLGAETMPPASTASTGASGGGSVPSMFPAGDAAPATVLPGETSYTMPGGGGGSDGMPPGARAPGAVPGPGTGGLPALIPGRDYSSGDTSNNFYRHTYADRSGPSPDSAPNGYNPNFTMPTGGGDEPFNRPGPVPLFPGDNDSAGGRGGQHLGISDLLFRGAALDYAGHIVAGTLNDVLVAPDQQVTQMELRDKRFTKADGDKVIAAAKKIVNENYGMSLVGALKLIQNGYVQTHDLDASIAMAGPLAADAMRLHNVGDDDAVDDIWDLQRSAEVAGMLNNKNKDGSVNVDPFTAWIDNATQIIQADQNVSPHDIWLATQQNDLGAMSADSQGQAEQDIVAGLLGGFKSGTGSAALEREMIGGKMSTGTAKTLEKLGLIDPAGAIKTGQYYTLKPGALKDEALFAKNPVEWFQKDFQPAVDRLSPGDRDAMFHDIIAGTGTASGAREAVVDVMQDALIARMLTYAYENEPDKAQSKTIIDSNPGTAEDHAKSGLQVLANSALAGGTSPAVGILNWIGSEATDLASHPFVTLARNLKDNYDTAQNVFSLGSTSVMEGVKDALIQDAKDFLTKIFQELISAVKAQGNSPSNALYIKPVPGGPSIVQPNTMTGHNAGLSPPTPGQVIRVP